jgi:hypothetical protein
MATIRLLANALFRMACFVQPAVMSLVVFSPTCHAISATATGSFGSAGASVAFDQPWPSTIYYAFSPPTFFSDGQRYEASVRAGIDSFHCFGNAQGDFCFALSGEYSRPGGFASLIVDARFTSFADPGASVTAMASAGGTEPYGDPDEQDDEEAAEPVSVGGAYLAGSQLGVPVVQEHGLTDFVWANAAPTEPSGEPSPFKAAYFFASTDIPFTQFVIPEALPGGDSEFEIVIGAYEHYALQAGVPFDFTTYFPEGVNAFLLTGFDADEGLVAGQSFPYTHGYRFAEEGATFVRHGPLTPGDFTLGGRIDEDDLAIWKASYGIDNSGDADGDGDSDGADFLIWQQHVSPASPTDPSTTVPEPLTSTLLTILCSCGAVLRRRLESGAEV